VRATRANPNLELQMSDANGSSGTGGKRLAVYSISEKDGERAWWQRIGTAFTNRDGSLTLYLDAFPLGTNKLHVREPRDETRPAIPGPTGAAHASRRSPVEEVQP
jgi:hypothetical protein